MYSLSAWSLALIKCNKFILALENDFVEQLSNFLYWEHFKGKRLSGALFSKPEAIPGIAGSYVNHTLLLTAHILSIDPCMFLGKPFSQCINIVALIGLGKAGHVPKCALVCFILVFQVLYWFQIL